MNLEVSFKIEVVNAHSLTLIQTTREIFTCSFAFDAKDSLPV
ncbi:Uncharacterized protein APZ42_030402 [Daphnia magna]|uniref:Uncharacterized protein n=1 Tax=Daphnia magna TaxID=35525 RepID=A0A164NSV6_9CRUS|nr:Uncharacterized protein APZ42_030402 [Daphnia magna]